MQGKRLAILGSIILSIGLLMVGSAGAAQRCVLAELMTNSGWGACSYANTALDKVVEFDFSPEELAVIRNGLGHFWTSEGAFRFGWYPDTWGSSGWAHYTPTLWVDGIDDITGAWADIEYTRSQYTALINTRLPVPSPLEMDLQVEYGARGDTGTVHIEVVATDSIVFTKMKLRACLIESNIYWDGDYHNQMARDYLPTQAGVVVDIAEGDTFNHSEDFVIDPDWFVEECDIVAFVQNGKNEATYPYEVVQAIQGPVYAPVPDEVTDLTITLVESDLRLEWSPVETDTSGNPITVDSYQIYRDTVDFFGPGSEPFDSTIDTLFMDDTGVVGDTGTQYYYAVTAVAGSKESGYSGVVGEFDRYVAVGE